MNDKINISKRLLECTSFLKGFNTIADIGTDHAYLPVYLILNKYVNNVVAGDVSEGPLNAAINTVDSYNLTKQIDCRLGSGLDVLDETVEAINIAGMGGSLIASILETGKDKLTNVSKLVLQPNNSSNILRKWLMINGYIIDDERIIKDNNIIYEIIVASKVETPIEYNQMDIMFGPVLRLEKSAIFLEKWQEYLNYLNRVIRNIPSENVRYQELQEEIQLIKSIL